MVRTQEQQYKTNKHNHEIKGDHRNEKQNNSTNGMENEWHLRHLLVPFYFKIKYGPHRAEQTIHELCLITRRGSTRLVHFAQIFMFIAFHCLMRHNNVCIL
jgi:hypothetical protein